MPGELLERSVSLSAAKNGNACNGHDLEPREGRFTWEVRLSDGLKTETVTGQEQVHVSTEVRMCVHVCCVDDDTLQCLSSDTSTSTTLSADASSTFPRTAKQAVRSVGSIALSTHP